MASRLVSAATVVLIGLLSLSSCSHAPSRVAQRSERGVLVLGASGKLGAETVKALLQRGYAVTAFVRPTSDLKRLDGLGIAYFVGDLTRDEDVRRAFSGRAYHTVIDCSARRGTTDPFYDASMRSILRWGRAAGLEHVILHSSVGVGESREIAEVAAAFETLQGEKRRIYESTMTEKRTAEELLKDSGLKYTIIRNWALMFEGTAATGMARLTEDLRALGRITRPDLAALGADCVNNPACAGRTFNALDDSITPK